MAELLGDFAKLGNSDRTQAFRMQSSTAVIAAFDALQNIFSASCLGGAVDSDEINSAGAAVISQIGSRGLGNWITNVRKHHSQTYQHSLLVTGLAVAFAQQLGASHNDRLRLSFAGLLHDIGKARIPTSILEKPGLLNQAERAVMQTHPQLGKDALSTAVGVDAAMLDMVLHHHEYLDGSGYPDGLQGQKISDFVRIVTVADIFGALIERRSYKAPTCSETAYQHLVDMGPKLDADLVREFRPVALSPRRS